MIDQITLGWMIGIIEGEGWIGLNGYGRSPMIDVAMTDEDIIIRLASIFEAITGVSHNVIAIAPRAGKKGRKEAWRVRSFGNQARTIIKLIIPYLGARRRKRAWQVLNGYKEPNLTLTDIESDNIIELSSAILKRA